MNPSIPTMADVARLAGVSVPTVSRVLNSPNLVKPDTQNRVNQAIYELKYRPNLAARALVTQQTQLVGVMMPSGLLYGPQATSNAIEHAALNAGYSTVVSFPRKEHDFTKILTHFKAINVDGLIIIAPTYDLANLAKDIAQVIPTVVISAIDNAFTSGDIGLVSINHQDATMKATQHLIMHGHKRIACLSGPKNWIEATARVKGWKLAMESANLSTSMCYSVGWYSNAAYKVAYDLLKGKNRPTGIIAANDDVAISIIAACTQLKLSCPDDVAIIGYDNLRNSPFLIPPLSSVNQPFEEAGEAAMRLLIKKISGQVTPPVMLEAALTLRRSCGCSYTLKI